MFGANRNALLYVLKREWALPRKKCDLSLEICVIERGGRAARCMGSVPVADLLASETRHAPPTGRRQAALVADSSAAEDLTNSLFPGDRSRESCGP